MRGLSPGRQSAWTPLFRCSPLSAVVSSDQSHGSPLQEVEEVSVGSRLSFPAVILGNLPLCWCRNGLFCGLNALGDNQIIR